MNLANIRLITFDVTNTLLNFRVPVALKYAEVAQKHGIVCEKDVLTKNLNSVMKNMMKDHPNFGRATKLGWRNWWRTVVVSTFETTSPSTDKLKLEAIADVLIKTFETEDCWEVTVGSEDLLSFLRNTHVTMGVISNFDPRLNTLLTNMKLRRYFSFVLTSYDVGFEKPRPEIFNEAVRVCGINDINSRECLHIGDNLAKDYYGATGCGWQAVLLNARNFDKGKTDGGVNISRVFESVTSLFEHFKKCNQNLIRRIK